MLVPNQKVEVKWNSRNVRWYKEKGYEYTKTGETFMCEVEDLMPSCKIKVKAICDYCGDILECENVNYNRAINKKGKISCGRKECIGNAISDAEKAISYNKYLEFCKNNNYKPHTSFDDYNGVRSSVKFECEKHGLQEMSAYYITHNDVMCHDCTLEKFSGEKRLSVKNLMDIVAKEDCDLLNPDDYINSHTSNLIFQNRQCGHVYTTSLDNFKKMKHKCTECAKIAIGNTFRLDYNHVKEFIESKNNNKLISKKYESARNKLEIECGSCKNIFYSSPASSYRSKHKRL